MNPCPCGKGEYASCCGRYHEGLPTPDAQSLMRSRYSAYVMELEPYLLATWHPDTRPERLDFDGRAKWLGLEIKRFEEENDRAVVEFVARYRIAGRAQRLHEISRFVLEGKCWLYVDGIFPGDASSR